MASLTIRMNANTSLGELLLGVPSGFSKPLTLVMHPEQGRTDPEVRFVFPYNPISITYNQLGDEVAQIPRPGTTPLVFFKAHRLMSVDITFTLAVPGDGLVQSVDEHIEVLRSMAANSQRVIQILNYDRMLTTPHAYRNMSKEQSATGVFTDLFFSIVELNVDSVRRNKLNQVTQANCRLSMIENRNPFQNITAIPKLEKPPPKPDCPHWKKCCPKKYAKECPDKEKVPPSIPISELIIKAAAAGIDIVRRANETQAAWRKRLELELSRE